MKLTCSVVALLTVAIANLTMPAQESDAEKVRIGTYDNRAIAIAYAASRFNPVKEKMAEYEKAKSAGDKQQIVQLEAWGERHQRELHRQGFAAVPVDDLLAHVKDKMAEVARTNRLAAIVRKCDYASDRVEIVDATQLLVDLFDPNEKTLQNIEMIKDKPFVNLDEIDQQHPQDPKSRK